MRPTAVSSVGEYRDTVDTRTIILLLSPIIVLQIILIVVALRSLVQPEVIVRGGSKALWGVVIVIFGIIGPLLYFTVGRETE